MCKQDASQMLQGQDKTVTYSLYPQATMTYAWDFPAAKEKKIILSVNGSRRVVDIMEIGDLIPFKFNVSG